MTTTLDTIQVHASADARTIADALHTIGIRHDAKAIARTIYFWALTSREHDSMILGNARVAMVAGTIVIQRVD